MPTPPLTTVQQYVTDARVQLLDTVFPYRYSDPELLQAMNMALLEARRMRPDLFFSRRRCQKLLRQVGNQIRRMEKDDAVASRAYTMLVGA